MFTSFTVRAYLDAFEEPHVQRNTLFASESSPNIRAPVHLREQRLDKKYLFRIYYLVYLSTEVTDVARPYDTSRRLQNNNKNVYFGGVSLGQLGRV